MNDLLNRFSQLPRAAKWAIVAGVAFVLYFVVVEPAIDQTNRVNAEADRVETQLAQLQELTESDPNREAMRRHFGEPGLPSAQLDRRTEFQTAVERILRDAGVTDSEQTERFSPIRTEQASGLLAENQRLVRLELVLRFSATPEALSAAVAQLEAEEVVTAVNRVRLDRAARRNADDRLVNATLGVETWVITPRSVR